MKNLLIATALIAIASTATAQDATVTTVVTEPTETVAAPQVITPPSAALLEQFNAICASTFKLSEKAQTACTAQTPPRAAKSGNTFRNTGIGTEFNTLIRQL